MILFEEPHQGLQGCPENAAHGIGMLVNVAVMAESEVLVALPGY